MALRTLVEAINDALRCEMAADERVILLGEDIGRAGGVFRVTEGLQAMSPHDQPHESVLKSQDVLRYIKSSQPHCVFVLGCLPV